jgi:hypothetical protein
MKTELALVLAMAALLTGCVLGGKQPTAKNVPPVTKAATDATPPTPVRNLSTPQTNVELPPPQPVPKEALEPPRMPQPEVAAPAQQAAKPKPRPPRTETAAPAQTPAPPPPATTETEAPRTPIQEIVPAEDQKRLQEEAAQCKREIQQHLEAIQAQGRRLKAREQQTQKFIESFLKQSGEAEARGDYKAAAELAQRGLALARELTGGK